MGVVLVVDAAIVAFGGSVALVGWYPLVVLHLFALAWLLLLGLEQ